MKNNRFNRKNFSLIEVTMAIGVIALGMVGIMALFPIGIQASRNAMGDNYSSDLADQFLHMIAMQVKAYSIVIDDTTGVGTVVLDGWGEWITDTSAAPDDPYVGVLPALKANIDNPLWCSNRLSDVISSGTAVLSEDFGIYYGADGGNYGAINNSDMGLFYVEQKSGEIVDFSAVMALWQEEIQYDVENTLPITKAVRLCVEISWPVIKPYDSREKRCYVLELFNPNDR